MNCSSLNMPVSSHCLIMISAFGLCMQQSLTEVNYCASAVQYSLMAAASDSQENMTLLLADQTTVTVTISEYVMVHVIQSLCVTQTP